MVSSALSCRARAAPSRPAVRRASTVRVSASLRPPQSFENLVTRYDWLSTGAGALCVTTYAVCRGQPPLEAAGVTVVATVAALVANELLFSPAPPAQPPSNGRGGSDNGGSN